MSHWDLIETSPCHPVENMKSDEMRLQAALPSDVPSIRFYRWLPCSVTYGYFLKPGEYFKEGQEDLLLARRPTGGGIILHDYDLAFSILIPSGHLRYSMNTIDNYAFVNTCLLQALKSCSGSLPFSFFKTRGECRPNFCMARSTIYDLVVDGKKVMGGAQRKTSRGFLHQGSICLRLPDAHFLQKHVKNHERYIQDLLAHSFPLLHYSQMPYEAFVNDLKQAIFKAFADS
ncbi:MAG: lipoate--protein ligase family protein [Parachlamydiaceae bacterium]